MNWRYLRSHQITYIYPSMREIYHLFHKLLIALFVNKLCFGNPNSKIGSIGVSASLHPSNHGSKSQYQSLTQMVLRHISFNVWTRVSGNTQNKIVQKFKKL